MDHDIDQPTEDDKAVEESSVYIVGGRLFVINAAICLSLFLVNLEITIVSTSLVAITNELAGFGKSSWVVIAYLVTFTGLLVIWAKLSDTFGRKWPLIVSLLIFIVFSGACGAAQTMTQLIILRAFQGIGSSGMYSLCMILTFELVPSHKYPTYTLVVTVVFTVSLLLGPLLGGVVNIHPAWRWVFLLNIPAGVLAVLVLLISLPDRFPLHRTIEGRIGSTWLGLVRAKLIRVDFIGAGLMLTANLSLLIAFQQATEGWKWSSPAMIVLLVLGGLLWASLLLWEWVVSSRDLSQEPVFPWRLITNRVTLGLLLNSFFTGVVSTVCVIGIPLKFQAVHGDSALQAGIRLLPFTILTPCGSMLAASLTGKAKMPPIYLQFVGAALQVIGVALMSLDANANASVSAVSYVFEVIIGLGIGISIVSVTIVAPFVIKDPVDLSIITSAVIQFRFIGGALGLAAGTCAMQNLVKRRLSAILTVGQLGQLFQSISVVEEFSPAVQRTVRQAFGQGFSLEMQIILGFAVAQFAATSLMWRNPPVRVK